MLHERVSRSITAQREESKGSMQEWDNPIISKTLFFQSFYILGKYFDLKHIQKKYIYIYI